MWRMCEGCGYTATFVTTSGKSLCWNCSYSISNDLLARIDV